jgi:hypothetical protein
MFFQTVKDFSAQRSGLEILFLALTQIVVVVVVESVGFEIWILCKLLIRFWDTC